MKKICVSIALGLSPFLIFYLQFTALSAITSQNLSPNPVVQLEHYGKLSSKNPVLGLMVYLAVMNLFVYTLNRMIKRLEDNPQFL